jgi:hypothetical protein
MAIEDVFIKKKHLILALKFFQFHTLYGYTYLYIYRLPQMKKKSKKRLALRSLGRGS